MLASECENAFTTANNIAGKTTSRLGAEETTMLLSTENQKPREQPRLRNAHSLKFHVAYKLDIGMTSHLGVSEVFIIKYRRRCYSARPKNHQKLKAAWPI